MDLASVVAALASVGVRVSGSAPNSSVQVDSSRACPTGLAGPEPSGTFHDPGQHFQTEDYQPLGEVLDQGLKELGYSREDLSVELFASDKQHVLDLYCSKGKNCSYKFY